MSKTVLLVGAGNMGFAMMRGWIATNPELRMLVVEPVEALRNRAAAEGAIVGAGIADFSSEKPNFIVLAVKPHLTAQVAAECAAFAAAGSVILSVAAGVATGTLATDLPRQAAIIRCMPNTPAAIGAGVMALFANDNVSVDARGAATRLMETSGMVLWLENEGQMDAITAISGSGPAYLFHFIEALSGAGQVLGLPQDTAAAIALQTVSGAAQLAAQSDTDPAELRSQVTSPGGTTAAALDVLRAPDGLTSLVKKAATAARDRSIALSRV